MSGRSRQNLTICPSGGPHAFDSGRLAVSDGDKVIEKRLRDAVIGRQEALFLVVNCS